MLPDLISIISLIVLVLLVWFNSEAFLEYAKLIGGRTFFEIDKYEEVRKDRASLDYLGYLTESHNSFFVKLITCPLCFSVWISIVVTFLLTDSLLLFPTCNVMSLIIYKITSNLLES
jgi:hypothetical protein